MISKQNEAVELVFDRELMGPHESLTPKAQHGRIFVAIDSVFSVKIIQNRIIKLEIHGD
jgi:hypothetical protein